MEIIGLSGYARSGKDEAARVLVEEFGFIRVAFADKLRDFLYALNPIVDYLDSNGDIVGPRKVQSIIDDVGWDGYKNTHYRDEIRRLLQRLGTEAGRETLWDSVWIDAALTGLPEDARVVITDARFENEAQAVTDRGGQMWRITRDGVGPINDHPSETSLDDWNFDKQVRNSGSLLDYRDNIIYTYKENDL